MIPHSRPTLDQTDYENVLQVLKSRNLVQGERVSRLENTLSALIGVRGGGAVSSGTAALHLSLISLGIGQGDEVILPSFVCSAPLNAIHYTGASPVICDIDRTTYNLDTADVKKRITKNTKAIILPHMFGLPADLDEMLSFGIPIIEDCAHSPGSLYRGTHAGSFGILSIFSFYATKMIASGEGGMVLSRNEELIETIRDLRDYDEKETYRVRYNYKMTDIQASLGIRQLRKLPFFIEKRQNIADIYTKELKGCGCTLPAVTEDRRHIFFRYVILAENALELIDSMAAKGIACRKPVFKPLHRYAGLSGCPNTEWVWERAVSIPIYPSLTEEEIYKILEALKSFTKKKVE
jgi:perosamine synthetase